MPFVKAVIERSPAVKKLDLNRPDPNVSKSPDVATIPLKESPVPYARARSAVDARLADIERLLHKIATVVVKQPGSTVLHDKLRNEASFLRKMKRQALYRPPPPPPSKPLPLTVRRTKKQRKVRQRELRALADPTLDNLEDLRFIFDDEPEARRNRKRTRNPDAPDAVTGLPLHDVEFGLRDDTGPPEPAPRRILRGRRRRVLSTPSAMTTRSQKRKRRA